MMFLLQHYCSLWKIKNGGISSIRVEEYDDNTDWYKCELTMINNMIYTVYIKKDHSNGWMIQRQRPGYDPIPDVPEQS